MHFNSNTDQNTFHLLSFNVEKKHLTFNIIMSQQRFFSTFCVIWEIFLEYMQSIIVLIVKANNEKLIQSCTTEFDKNY